MRMFELRKLRLGGERILERTDVLINEDVYQRLSGVWSGSSWVDKAGRRRLKRLV